MPDHPGYLGNILPGLMTTGHETGASLGVPVLSAIATAAALTGSFASGYRAAQWAATLIAASLVLVTVLFLPAVRPPAGTGPRMH